MVIYIQTACVPKLAERIPGDRVDGLACGVPATTLVAGLEARACASLGNGTLRGQMTMPTTHISTTPYWATSATFPPFAKLAEDAGTDVVIVGAGVTGLTAAYLLAKAGKRVVVLERDRCAAVALNGVLAVSYRALKSAAGSSRRTL